MPNTSNNWHRYDPVYKDVEWVEHVDWCPCHECAAMRREVEADRRAEPRQTDNCTVDARQQ